MLRKSPWVARVIWTGSLDVEHALVEMDWNDWQLIKAMKVYESSKYQLELVSVILDMEASARNPPSGRSPIRHLISHPGVTCTNIFSSKLNFITEFLMWLSFMIVSLLSPSRRVRT
jgi:3-keto steroid reductase